MCYQRKRKRKRSVSWGGEVREGRSIKRNGHQ